ncbi:LysR family transcriptional regulator [Isobaculum melis]|uniref:DNA-binding transcriptional regulator, LysR family n=1 Tax=Isobaculum melis TaxID=142588 RepID=A0A1H9SZ60_9LACT|nr:LysR family transcriptional regulator [Isobaculum melis]SER90158.1 DNA-binding transcriptional regulator, LysR family [Isobaculum melis]
MQNQSDNVFSSKTLNYFLQLSETMNYTQAAQLLGITQPALTQQIKKLERIVGAPLFYSIGKKLHLSEAGKTMLRTTHEVYELLNTATDEIQQSTSADIGRIRVGILSSIELRVFTDFIIEYFKNHPKIEIAVYTLSRKEIWEKLENNKIDLAIMYLPDESIKNWKPYKTRKIIEEELLFLHHDQALEKKKKIRLAQTLSNSWTMYPDSFYLNDMIKEHYINHMTDLPTFSVCFTTPQQIFRFSNATEFYTALPKSYIRVHEQEASLKAIPFEPSIKFDMVFVYRSEKEDIPRIHSFLTGFDDYLKKIDYLAKLN